MTDLAKLQRLGVIQRAFTPSAPVSRLDMLAGRMAQLTDVIRAVNMSGQHVGLYGERGVGKTSLANVLHEVFERAAEKGYRAVLVNCTTDDDFRTIWRSVFMDLGLNVDEFDYETYTPEGVRRVIEQYSERALIVLDELDRLENNEALTALADTIKTFSDHAVPSTIVLVGVARSLGQLIGEHESIVRALVQIEMPRMSTRELAEILEKGCSKAQIAADPDAITEIAMLSEGLPHYAHLLGLHAAERAVQNDRELIEVRDVHAAIPIAVNRHTIVDAYQQATRSTRPDALFPQVLLACALAPKNELGFFTSGSIRDPLETIAGRRLEIPAFSNHLSQFLEPDRGSVLQREGTSRRYFYRFSDPIFQPYVVLHGLSTGMITDEQRRKFQAPPASADLTPSQFEIDKPQPLF
jgi:Cdc6-like AAA superfamily ATPase